MRGANGGQSRFAIRSPFSLLSRQPVIMGAAEISSEANKRVRRNKLSLVSTMSLGHGWAYDHCEICTKNK